MWKWTEDDKKRLFDALLDGTLTTGPWSSDGTYSGPFFVHAPLDMFGMHHEKGDTLTIDGLTLA